MPSPLAATPKWLTEIQTDIGKGLNVLGLCSTGHGAAAALVSASHGVRAMVLERFTGLKHSMLFTRQELDDIINGNNVVDAAIRDALIYSWGNKLPPAFTIEETLLPFLKAMLRGLPLRPRDIDLVVTSDCHFGFNRGRIGSLLNAYFPNAEIHHNIEHHKIHQHQAFLPSPFTEAAILTLDESGEELERLGGRRIAMTLSHAHAGGIDVAAELLHPESSPGLMYAVFSRHLGYGAGEEGKTMGLAPYGMDVIYKRLRPHLTLHPNGAFQFLRDDELGQRLHNFTRARAQKATVEPIHADIAYAAQRILEDILCNAIRALERMIPDEVEHLCLAGGVALNSCANEKLFRASRFTDVYIMPNAGDNGHALACALYGTHILKGQAAPASIRDEYLGPVYDEESLTASLADGGYDLVAYSDDEIADLLSAGYIIGLFQGGSEFGPRALGNRSILADPRPAEMKTIINERVKHRELFRPYAPVVMEEKVSEWFDHAGPSHFMLRVVQVLPEKRDQIAAVTHVDGSARVQTITRELNPRLYSLVEAFHRRTGVPVLLNTSFNLAGRPIVETPADAIECFQSTGLDGLILGQYFIAKPGVHVGARGAVGRLAAPTAEQLRARHEYAQLEDYAAVPESKMPWIVGALS